MKYLIRTFLSYVIALNLFNSPASAGTLNIQPAGRPLVCTRVFEKLTLNADHDNVAFVPQVREPNTPRIPRLKFQSHRGRLVIEIVDNDMLRFEWSANQGLPPDSDPIYSSPLTHKKVYEGPTEVNITRNGTLLETPTMIIDIDPNDLGFTIFDKRKNQIIASIRPDDLNSPYKRIAIDNTGMQDPDIEGIGAMPRSANTLDSGWKRHSFTVPNSFGNGMTNFDYNAAPTTSQLPAAFFHNGKNNYGLMVDNPLKTEWFFANPNHGSIGMWGDYPRLYLILGENNPDIHRKFMGLQGHPSLPPKHMMGWGLSKFGYRNWTEMFNDLRELEQAGIPLPRTVYLDLQWFGESFKVAGKPQPSDNEPSRMGNVDWDRRPDKFPHPEETIAWLKARGIELIPIHESYVRKDTADFAHMAANGYFVKNSDGTPVIIEASKGGFWKFDAAMMDWSNPDARKYWFDTRLLALAKLGMHNYWLDLGDPEMYNDKGIYRGADGQGHSHADNHNLYNNLWVQGIEEGYRRHNINARPVTVSRAMTLGPKGMNWSGDINGSPESMKAHIREALDASWAGQYFYGSDSGGFWRRWPDWRIGQLYTRWLVTTLYGGEIPAKVHVFNLFDDQQYLPTRIGELESHREALAERDAMAPYYYSLAWDAHLNGAPLRSSPSFYNQTDYGLKGFSQFIVGRNDLLVAPSIEIDEAVRNVRLPSGHDWVHYETHQSYSGGQIVYDVPTRTRDGKFRPPLFARAGAMFPRTEQERATIERNKNYIPPVNHDFILRVFPSEVRSSFKHFEDDGVTRDFENGEVRITDIAQQKSGKTMTVDIEPSQGSYKGAPEERRYKIEFATQELDVDKVYINGHELLRCTNPQEFGTWHEGYLVDSTTKKIIVKTGLMHHSWKKSFSVVLR